jgi:RHS repeat-associated protein
MGGQFEVKDGTTKKYYSIAGMMVATQDASGLQYLLTDHLGSTVAVTNSSGTLTSQQRYLPFGGTRAIPNSPILATDFGYTGQRMLDSGMGGIMDYKARFYSPYLNRFIQPDSIIPDQTNPQSWNRFSYVQNNPIRFNDPSGHCPEEDLECRIILSQTLPKVPGGGGEGGGGSDDGGVLLSTRGQQLLDFAESFNMTPEEVIGIGLGHEMFADNEEERAIHMELFRNGFLGYANDPRSHCNGNPTYNCMLNYFSSAYESVYNQFLEDGVPATHWNTPEEYLFDQYKDSRGRSNLGPGNQEAVKLGMDFMVGTESTGSFMDTISDYSFDPNLGVSSGVVDAQALNQYLHGYPTAGMGFLVVKNVTCPNTGAAGYTLYYNMSGIQTLTNAGLGVC